MICTEIGKVLGAVEIYIDIEYDDWDGAEDDGYDFEELVFNDEMGFN